MRPPAVLAALLTAASALGQVETAPASRPAITLLIIHTNDIHGQIRPVPDPRSRDGRPRLVGGFQEMVEAIDEERAAVAHSVWVDAGDWWQGTPEGTLSRGRCSVELMNAAGVDFAAVGNHDFDAGPEALLDLLRLARFEVLGANVGAADESDPVAVAVDDLIAAGPRFVRAGPFTLAVAGLVTEETPRLVGRNALKGLHVGGELAAARAVRSVLRLPADRERAADASRPASAGRLDADGLLFVNHVARDRNLLLAREIPDADVIIGGHNHADPLATGVTAPSGALLAQAAATTRAFGAVRLEIDPETRRIRSKTARLRWIDGRPDAAVSRLAPIVKRYEDETAARMNVPVCVVPTALGRDPDPENPGPLGAWLGAAMRAASGAEVAVHNQGGIRADLPAGVARVREFFQVSPFGNRLVSATLKARDLRALAERTARAPGRGFVVVGLEVAARKTADGLQVVALRRNGEPLDDDAAVRVVTTDFLAFGGDAASPFGRATDLVDHDVTLLDATLAFARRSETLVAPPPARWTIVP